MKHNPWSRTRRCGSRSGFTLLETILALSLSALLLGAIYAAIDQSWRTSASGREEMERAQLARALIHKIEVDIRAITFVPPPPVDDSETAGTTSTSNSSGTGPSSSSGSSGGGGGGGGSGGGGGNGGSTGSGTSGGSGGGSGGSGGTSRGSSGSGGSSSGSSGSKSGSGSGSGGSSSGGSNSGGGSGGGSSGGSGGGGGSGSGSSGSSGSSFGGLAANNSSSSSTSSSTDTTEAESTGPNSKSLGIRGTSQKFEISISRPRRDLLPGAAGSSSRTSDLRQVSYSFLPTGSVPMAGLVRTEGDRMAVETLESTGGTSTQISSVQSLAPEVSAFRVRYFDGRSWYESWDTDTSGRIPRAVEVSIAFTPPKRKPPLFSAPFSRSMDSFRTVILIPVSDPYPQDFVQ